MSKRIVTISAVVVSAFIVTALGIDAADTVRGSSGTMLASLLGTAPEPPCPADMVHVGTAQTFSCVDRYEAAAGASCVSTLPKSPVDTEANIGDRDCVAVSSGEAIPWRFIVREEAEIACARAGKRLPTAAEWYTFARDTPVDMCNVRSGSVSSGVERDACASVYGVVHAVGNVWEWVRDDVVNGVWQNRALPPSGYVAQVDSSGIATETTTEGRTGYYEGVYFWSSSEGVQGMIRGGFYGSREDAGVATVHAATAATFAGDAVGFRCVR